MTCQVERVPTPLEIFGRRTHLPLELRHPLPFWRGSSIDDDVVHGAGRPVVGQEELDG